MSPELMQRCFVAWTPAPHERAALASLQDRVRAEREGPGHRWIVVDQLHVTVRFLGDTSAAQREGVAQSLAELAAATDAFDASVAALRYWPSARNPRVLVLELASGGAFEALGAAAETRMRALGFAPERRDFRAHLTLARIRSTKVSGAALPQLAESIRLAVDHVALVRSTLRPTGSEYEELARWPLRRVRLGALLPATPV